ncbi:hypothetical protein Bca101_083797 [Brassica carinata]
MGDYSEDENSYDSNQDSNLDETDQAWSSEEDGCDGSCSDDNYSMSEYGDDPDEAYPEPEPPDYSHEDTNHQGEYEGETESNISFKEEDDFPGDDTERDDQDTDQEDSRQEESDSEISLEEVCEHEETFSETGDVDEGEACSQSGETEDREESYVEERAWCDYSDLEDNQLGETESQLSLGDIEEEAENRHGFAKKEKSLSEAGEDEDEYEADHQPHYICFSGHEQGPEAYLRWEQDMDDWFQHHNIQEEEKLIIAEDTLTKNAFWHWDLEANYWLDDHPSEASWADMKEILREEYVVDAEINGKDYFKSTTHPEPRRLILKTRPNRKVKLNKAHDPKPNQESKLFNKGKTELTSPERFNGVQVDPTPQAKTQELTTSDPLKLEDVSDQAHEERYETGAPFSKEPMKPKKVVLKRDDKAPPKEPSLFSEKNSITTNLIPLQEEPPDQSQNIQAVPLEAPIKVPHQVQIGSKTTSIYHPYRPASTKTDPILTSVHPTVQSEFPACIKRERTD